VSRKRVSPPITVDGPVFVPLVGVNDVARYIGGSTKTVHKLVRAGIIPAIKLERQLRFDMAKVRDAIARRRATTDD
jgi:RNA:NAD 2'-phosphotransferase (TPT1/KptA family)